ncbi:MAG: hypothetical protein DA407_12475 [Bacteroidetes bacterium]|nr:MAG: hypothetical protein DA407_12475 [Bacteroidota bacterium]
MEQLKPSRPESYLALAIISTIICCVPLGIVSILYATKVNSLYEDGSFDEATRASKNAKTWGLITIGAGVLIYLGVFLIYGAILMAALSNGDF